MCAQTEKLAEGAFKLKHPVLLGLKPITHRMRNRQTTARCIFERMTASDRPPSPGKVTLATITISPAKAGPINLSRVNFGLHNGVFIGDNPVLRIDNEPFGALKRAD